MLSESDLKRLEDKLYYEPNTGCWLFAGGWAHGYGSFWFDGALRRAHRVVFQHFKGQIPEGYHIDHLCRVRCCVNPDHLEAVTHLENVRRGRCGNRSTNPAVIYSRKITHCKYGHPFSGENLAINYKGNRVCRICRAAGAARYRNRHPERIAEYRRYYQEHKRPSRSKKAEKKASQ